jgi:glycosyltransferase involved in cell wall biosynthesis
LPKFSIIMQCYLGDYPGAASKREEKLIRAIDSVLDQSFTDWELVIVADGCDKTYQIVSENYSGHKGVDCYLISKQAMWTGSCRNFGISKAKGEWICYLDADDYFGENHLDIIYRNMPSDHELAVATDWVWFNDLVKSGDKLLERTALITQRYQYGTANICHRRTLGAKWTSSGYGMDDYGIGQNLLSLSKNYEKIQTPQYVVCHIPGKIDE